MASERYFIGPGLKDKLREVIYRVDGLASVERGVKAPTVEQSLPIFRTTFRICTFTGAWSKSQQKTVTFKFDTNTPNTVSATNLFATIGSATSSRNCAVAREGTAWYLIAAECD
jgi:hypothetical protein